MSIESILAGYEASLHQDVYESLETRVLSTRICIEDFMLLQAIADFYRRTRSGVSQDFLQDSLHDFFKNLPESSRLSIATSAHELYVKEMEKIAKENQGSFEILGYSKWLAIAKAMSGEFQKELISNE